MKQAETMSPVCTAQVQTELDTEHRAVRFRICGEIDHHGARFVREEMDAVIARYHPMTVRLLLREVSFMDSAGLGLMLGRYTRIKEYGGELILTNPTPPILKILALAGADKLLPIEFCKNDTDQEAQDVREEERV